MSEILLEMYAPHPGNPCNRRYPAFYLYSLGSEHQLAAISIPYEAKQDGLLTLVIEDEALETSLSSELHVTSDTPAVFLFATTDDGIVPVQNSLAFYQACIDHHVSAEMHLFEHGPHGVVLAQNLPGASAWPDLLETWMTRHGWMKQ